jgi:hypothetical protein
MSHSEYSLTHRRTILIASSVSAYAEAVAEMVARAGFVPAFPTTHESPWITVARTQPCVVIFDCEAPVRGLQRLADESSARRVPLVFSGVTDGVVDITCRHHVARSVSIERPVSDTSFCAIIDTIVTRPRDAAHRLRPTAPRLTIVANSRRRTTSIAAWAAALEASRLTTRVGPLERPAYVNADDDAEFASGDELAITSLAS